MTVQSLTPDSRRPSMTAILPAMSAHNHSSRCSHHGQVTASDLELLSIISGSPPKKRNEGNRRPTQQMEPLILQTASLSGPGTRNHYMHGGLMYPHAQMYASCDSLPAPVFGKIDKPAVASRQAPRRVRLAEAQRKQVETQQELLHKQEESARKLSHTNERINLVKTLRPSNISAELTVPKQDGPVKVKCHARTRVPTPHGDVFLHVYKNNQDAKEHLAFVFDKAQLDMNVATTSHIRSASLDAVWRAEETDQERIVRGAYVGRLTPSASRPSTSASPARQTEATLVRIHSECFTGETIGSQRCDCGEQLDEAFRLISSCPAKKGVIVYLRQEGRGIGLLEKVRAYNLQDLGHDTVAANLLLGHRSDMRTYDIAAGILRDLGISQVKLLTNNPDKVTQAGAEGIQILERVPMVPRSWRLVADRQVKRTHQRARRRQRAADLKAMQQADETTDYATSDPDSEAEAAHMDRQSGVGMIGGDTTSSIELDRYLKTKIERMGHMLEYPTPATQPTTPDLSDSPDPLGRPFKPATSRRRRRPVDLADSLTDLQTDSNSIGSPDMSDGDRLRSESPEGSQEGPPLAKVATITQNETCSTVI